MVDELRHQILAVRDAVMCLLGDGNLLFDFVKQFLPPLFGFHFREFALQLLRLQFAVDDIHFEYDVHYHDEQNCSDGKERIENNIQGIHWLIFRG